MLIWVGVKMLLKVDVLYIPTPISLAVITLFIGGSIVASLLATRGQERHASPAPSNPPFRMATAEEIAELEPTRRQHRPVPPTG